MFGFTAVKPRFFYNGEAPLNIEHRLLTLQGAALGGIKNIYSHEQAIKQCGRFIRQRLSGVKVHYLESTAKAASMIKTESDAAIVGSHFIKEGFELSGYSVSDDEYNVTRFVLIEKGRDKLKERSKKIFVAVSANDRPGALLDILVLFKEHKLNMTKIESRPLKTKLGEYMFLIEFAGDIFNSQTEEFLQILEQNTKYFRLLGCY